VDSFRQVESWSVDAKANTRGLTQARIEMSSGYLGLQIRSKQGLMLSEVPALLVAPSKMGPKKSVACSSPFLATANITSVTNVDEAQR
jgi:hypothetical protein